jgi:hypothetical protein
MIKAKKTPEQTMKVDFLPPFPVAAPAMSALRAKAESCGSGEFSPSCAGENATGCREIPAADLTRASRGSLMRWSRPPMSERLLGCDRSQNSAMTSIITRVAGE